MVYFWLDGNISQYLRNRKFKANEWASRKKNRYGSIQMRSAHIEFHYWRDELNKYDNAIGDHLMPYTLCNAVRTNTHTHFIFNISYFLPDNIWYAFALQAKDTHYMKWNLSKVKVKLSNEIVLLQLQPTSQVSIVFFFLDSFPWWNEPPPGKMAELLTYKLFYNIQLQFSIQTIFRVEFIHEVSCVHCISFYFQFSSVWTW